MLLQLASDLAARSDGWWLFCSEHGSYWVLMSKEFFVAGWLQTPLYLIYWAGHMLDYRLY